MRVRDILDRLVWISREENRLISNGFCYNPEQLEAKLDTLEQEDIQLHNMLSKKLGSLPTRRQYDNLVATIDSAINNC